MKKIEKNPIGSCGVLGPLTHSEKVLRDFLHKLGILEKDIISINLGEGERNPRDSSGKTLIFFHRKNTDVIKGIAGVDFIVVPFFNTIGRTVKRIKGELIKHLFNSYRDEVGNERRIQIISSVKEKIRHVLAVDPESNISQVTQLGELYSHEQGFIQCEEKILETISPENRHKMEMTAPSPELIAENKGKAVGYICSEKAAQELGLQVIDSQFSPENNYTVFLMLSLKENILQEGIGESEFSLGLVSGKSETILELTEFLGTQIQDEDFNFYQVDYDEESGGEDTATMIIFPRKYQSLVEEKIAELSLKHKFLQQTS